MCLKEVPESMCLIKGKTHYFEKQKVRRLEGWRRTGDDAAWEGDIKNQGSVQKSSNTHKVTGVR